MDGPARGRRLGAWAAVNAVAAWAGGLGLCAGVVDFGEAIDGRLPFDSVVLAGLALIIVVGIPLTALAWSAVVGSARTDDLAFVAGLLLIGWILVQIAVIRAFSWFQPAYLVIGAGFVAASHRVAPSPLRRGVERVITFLDDHLTPSDR